MSVERGGLSPKAKEVVESISRDRLGLRESVRDLAPEQMDFRPAPGSWSIDDVLHHLALAEEASAKLMAFLHERALKESVGPDPEPDASVVRSIDSILEGVDGADGKASAPDRVTPRSKVEAPLALARLESARSRILESLESLSPFDGRKLTYRHPFFGELDLYQWLLIGGWHERRHTRQIERIKGNSGFPIP
jgi:hypothetical protein